jgi:sn-glycerol 3-phosphate transport system ATP-binding protein
MRVEIKRLQRRLGVTSIYVTHDQVEAMTLSDQLVVMSAGQIEQIGAPTELYRRPRTRFVAGFIGSPGMNFLAGRIEGPGSVSVAGQRLAVTDMPAGLGAGTPVDVGIRPEHVRVIAGEAGDLTFAAEFVEELGATQLIHGRVGESALTIQVPTGSVPTAGTLALSVPPGSVHLFDAATGLRLGVA